MRDYTKFRKKQIGQNLVPEFYDGYDYQYQITQQSRNSAGLLDNNSVFQGKVVEVIKITDGEYPYVVVAKLNMLDEVIPEKETYINYASEDSFELSLMDEFVPSSTDLREPAPGELIYVSYDDVNNRLGGTYLGPAKSADLAETVIANVYDTLDSVKKIFNSPSSNKTTVAAVGDCRYSNRETGQVDYSQCSSENRGPGEYELIFGEGKSAGTAKMVLIDFNPKANQLIQETAYRSLKKMFEDAASQGIKLKINQGYRSYEKQECYYRNYKACLDEWNKSGRRGPKPSAAANPKRSTNKSSNHMNGKAADFNTGVSRQDPKLKEVFKLASSRGGRDPASALELTKERIDDNNGNFSKHWSWLIKNSERYGWIWSGIKFREPWHFHFDENLARKNNLL